MPGGVDVERERRNHLGLLDWVREVLKKSQKTDRAQSLVHQLKLLVHFFIFILLILADLKWITAWLVRLGLSRLELEQLLGGLGPLLDQFRAVADCANNKSTG